jgi:hypothetical protein
MSVQTTSYDVFLSYSLTEAGEADLIERALTEAGLDVFSASKAVEPSDSAGDVLWQALAESAALVVLVHPQRPPSSSVLVELGAAKAWLKPVYVVQMEPGTAKLPSYLEQFPVYPVGRLDDLAGAVKRSMSAFNEQQRSLLREVYRDLRIPADQLLRDPAALDRLAAEFNRRCDGQFPGERLVQELLRLRKGGTLPRVGDGTSGRR